MKNKVFILGLMIFALLFSTAFIFSSKSKDEPIVPRFKTFHDFKVKTIDGKTFNLSKLKGKKVLVVNTASNCGFTPQYEVLQQLYEKLDKSKFEIIGFPANNFKAQEPGTDSEIQAFCTKNYGVTFPLMAKVSVCDYIYQTYPIDTARAESTTTDEIYQWLTKKELNGVMDTKIEWNFQKFLIDENGKLLGTIPPRIGKELILLKDWFSE